jgi:hypothetical protein
MCWRGVLILLLLVESGFGAELALEFKPTADGEGVVGFTNLVTGEGRPGRWRVLDAPGPGGTNVPVLAQTSMDVKDERFPLLLYEGMKFDDFTLTMRFQLVEGVVEQMGGIVFRCQDEKSYYVVRASGIGNNVRFYKVVGGIRGTPIGPNLAVPRGKWHELRIECEGNKIRVWFNGEKVIPELTDTSFRSGRIGFWTKSDAVTYFADTRIRYTPREPQAGVLVREAMAAYPRLVGLKIYLPDEKGEPRIVASHDPSELGAAGGASERGTIAAGSVFYGSEKETVSVVQPLRDHNGDPIAAVRVVLERFAGQTEQTAWARALPVVRYLQARVLSVEDLR